VHNLSLHRALSKLSFAYCIAVSLSWVLGGFPRSGARTAEYLSGWPDGACSTRFSCFFFLPPRLCAGVVALFWSSFGDGLVVVRFCRGVRRAQGVFRRG